MFPYQALRLDSGVSLVMPQREPRRFASDVTVYTQAGDVLRDTVEVNHPLKIAGWDIYQLSYDEAKGRWSNISVFELVRDPWLPYVYVGIVIMMLGAIGLVVYAPLAGFVTCGRWRYKWILAFGLVLALVFVCIYLLKVEMRDEMPMPALQSPWFAPHVAAYMFAYSLLGAAAVMAVYLLWFKRKGIEPREMNVCDTLVYVGLAFLTLGMLSGAIWAKAAWGHYWAWDPKETWAAVTWFSYLAYVHFRLGCLSAHRKALFGLLVAFLLLQMCWYGINYLPAAQGASMHIYN